MLTVITGASGFLGRALVARMRALDWTGTIRLVDRVGLSEGDADEVLNLDLGEEGAVEHAVTGATHVLHLAAFPGGAAEADPAQSERVNLAATLALAKAAAAAPHPVRFVYASSIAVFGAPLPAAIDDDTPVLPTMTYGTHKAMVELALADLARRGELDAISVRLSGVVARPRAVSGLKSAFMSDIFHAMAGGEDVTLPVGPDATAWLVSAAVAADALLHAVRVTLDVTSPRILTLPALRVAMADLVAAIAARTGSPSRVGYASDPAIEAQFGRLPPLTTAAADTLGFRHDGSIEQLVERVLIAIAAP
jgi:nucleoside-diphosphate-sugar epimerase